MYTYKVKKKCFVDGVLRVPGGRHDPYRTATKLEPQSSALELIEEKDVPKKKPRSRKSAAPKAPEIQGMKMKGENVVFKDQPDLEVI